MRYGTCKILFNTRDSASDNFLKFRNPNLFRKSKVQVRSYVQNWHEFSYVSQCKLITDNDNLITFQPLRTDILSSIILRRSFSRCLFVNMSVHSKNPLKLLLRKKIKSTLSNLCDSIKHDQSSTVAEKVIFLKKTRLIQSMKFKTENITLSHKILSSDVFKKAQRIGIYLSLSNEISTESILQEALQQKKEVSTLNGGSHQ